MQVVVNRDPKLTKIDHLFVLLAEGETAAANEHPGVQDAIARAKFSGRSDESITILADGPRKITLIGLGKTSELTIRGVRSALFAIAKTAKKQRDNSIAVVFPYIIGRRDAAQTTRILADHLSHSDYKYDGFITVRKDQKQP